MNKLDCKCGHSYSQHLPFYSPTIETRCWAEIKTNEHISMEMEWEYIDLCQCREYNPIGQNPEIYNIICSQCKLTWMVPHVEEPFYGCHACNFTLFNWQLEEMSKEGKLQ